MDRNGYITTLKVERFSKLLKDRSNLKIIAHNDYDGISSGYLFSKILDSLQISYELLFVRGFSQVQLSGLTGDEVILDLGATYISEIMDRGCLVIDHHKLSVISDWPGLIHPIPQGINPGETTTANLIYLLGVYLLGDDYRKYSWIAHLSTIGDMASIMGLNNFSLSDSLENGQLELVNFLEDFGSLGKSLIDVFQGSLKNNPPERILAEVGQILSMDPYIISRISYMELYPEDRILINNILSRYDEELVELYLLRGILTNPDLLYLNEARVFVTLVNSLGKSGMYMKAFNCIALRTDTIREGIVLQKANRYKLSKIYTKISKDKYPIHKLRDTWIVKVDGIDESFYGGISNMLLRSNPINSALVYGPTVDTGEYKISLRSNNIDVHNFFKENFTDSEIKTYGGHKFAGGAIMDLDQEDKFINKCIAILDN